MDTICGVEKSVVLAASHLLKELQRFYGEDRAMEMWDGIRAHVDKNLANAVLLGRIAGVSGDITIINCGNNKIRLIKEIRGVLNCGLKEAKDMSEGTQNIRSYTYGAEKLQELVDVLVRLSIEGVVYKIG